MLKLNRILIFLAFMPVFVAKSQNTPASDSGSSYNKYKIPSIYIGPSLQSFYGDLGENKSGLYFNTRFKAGINIGIEKRFTKTFGAGINSVYGKLSDSEIRKDGRRLNFETTLFNAEARVYIHFDNDKIINNSSRYTCHFFTGFGFMSFDPYTDLKDANGGKYHYWKDGSIRDRVFDPKNPQLGNYTERDYDYETKLDSLNKYKNFALTIPVGIGMKYKLSDKFEVNMELAYFLTNSDRIDNQNYKDKPEGFFKGTVDGFLQGAITLQFNPSGKTGRNKFYDKINFADLDREDNDGDGVADKVDLCPETPSGAPVNANGCPLDTDNDGIADYKDKEPNTAARAYVDENGITLSDSMLYALYLKDSLLTVGEYEFFKDGLAQGLTIEQIVAQRQRDKEAIAAREAEEAKTKPIGIAVNIEGGEEVVEKKDKIWEIVEDSSKLAQATDAQGKKIEEPYKEPEIKEISSVQKGIIYRVQISSSQTKVSPTFFLKNFGIKHEVYVSFQMGAYKYCIGSFKSYAEAKAFNSKFKQKFQMGSFITPYKDGVRITLQEAQSQK